jgi:hypothetical protein
VTANGAVQIFKDVESAMPDAQLYGPDGVCESGFTNPEKDGIPKEVGEKFKCTVATLDLQSYPGGQEFIKAFEAEYGEANPDPYAIYGYEAMDLVIDTIKAAGAEGTTREGVLKQLFQTKDRDSVLGHLLDRRERRHVADRLRPVRRRRRGRPDVRVGDQGRGLGTTEHPGRAGSEPHGLAPARRAPATSHGHHRSTAASHRHLAPRAGDVIREPSRSGGCSRSSPRCPSSTPSRTSPRRGTCRAWGRTSSRACPTAPSGR